MKTVNRISKMGVASGLSILAAAALCFPVSAETPGKSASAAPEHLAKQRQEIMAQRERMLAEARAADAALTKLVKEMNEAPEAKKVDLEAAILTKLVAQHHQMVSQWEHTHARMVEFNKEHAPLSKSSMDSAPGASVGTAHK